MSWKLYKPALSLLTGVVTIWPLELNPNVAGLFASVFINSRVYVISLQEEMLWVLGVKLLIIVE